MIYGNLVLVSLKRRLSHTHKKKLRPLSLPMKISAKWQIIMFLFYSLWTFMIIGYKEVEKKLITSSFPILKRTHSLLLSIYGIINSSFHWVIYYTHNQTSFMSVPSFVLNTIFFVFYSNKIKIIIILR